MDTREIITSLYIDTAMFCRLVFVVTRRDNNNYNNAYRRRGFHTVYCAITYIF